MRISIPFFQHTNDYGDGTVLVEWNLLHDVKQTLDARPKHSSVRTRSTPKCLKELVEHVEGTLLCLKCRQIVVKAGEEWRG